MTEDEEEAQAYHWLLIQRLLHHAGQLEPWKVAQLDRITPWNWKEEISDADCGYALMTHDPELQDAFAAWWNSEGLAPHPVTFAEIFAKAQREMGPPRRKLTLSRARRRPPGDRRA